MPGNHRLRRHFFADVGLQLLPDRPDKSLDRSGKRRAAGKAGQLYQMALQRDVLQGKTGITPAVHATVQAGNHQDLTPLADDFHLQVLEAAAGSLRRQPRRQHQQTHHDLPDRYAHLTPPLVGAGSIPACASRWWKK